MAQIKKVPELRFNGFNDEWEEKRLWELCHVKTGFPFESSDFIENGEYLVVTNSNVQNNSANVVNNIGNRINLINSNFRKYILNIDDILVTMDGTVGRTAKVVNSKMILAQRVGWLIANSVPNYIYSYLSTGQFFKNMALTAKGGTIKHISLSDISNYSSYSTSELLEQTQIGNCFKTFDELITLQEQKRTKLEELKKSMLNKMFPKVGTNVPEIRFRGFTEKWEERKLEEICTFSKGNGYSKNDLRGFGVPIILYGRMYTKYRTSVLEVDTFSFGSDKAVYSKGNEVIVPASGETAEDISRASAVLKAGIILGGDINVLIPNYLINSIFLALSLSHGHSKYELSKRAKGKSVVHIHNSDLKDVAILYPSLSEQQKIGAYFEELDKSIEGTQQQIEKFKHIKQALLSKMFV